MTRTDAEDGDHEHATTVASAPFARLCLSSPLGLHHNGVRMIRTANMSKHPSRPACPESVCTARIVRRKRKRLFFCARPVPDGFCAVLFAAAILLREAFPNRHHRISHLYSTCSPNANHAHDDTLSLDTLSPAGPPTFPAPLNKPAPCRPRTFCDLPPRTSLTVHPGCHLLFSHLINRRRLPFLNSNPRLALF